MWKPKEIIIHKKIINDPVTTGILQNCTNMPVKHVNNSKASTIVETSDILQNSKSKGMLDTILAGKQVLFIAPATNNEVDQIEMPDDRLMCPHFDRLSVQ